MSEPLGELTPEEIYLVHKARDLRALGCAYVTTNHGVLMTYAEHGRVGALPESPSAAAISAANSFIEPWVDGLSAAQWPNYQRDMEHALRAAYAVDRGSV